MDRSQDNTVLCESTVETPLSLMFNGQQSERAVVSVPLGQEHSDRSIVFTDNVMMRVDGQKRPVQVSSFCPC